MTAAIEQSLKKKDEKGIMKYIKKHEENEGVGLKKQQKIIQIRRKEFARRKMKFLMLNDLLLRPSNICSLTPLESNRYQKFAGQNPLAKLSSAKQVPIEWQGGCLPTWAMLDLSSNPSAHLQTISGHVMRGAYEDFQPYVGRKAQVSIVKFVPWNEVQSTTTLVATKNP
ncbi:hypothetical protein CPB84DRAFT_1742913 [Gymnopilus junonius]|uniref:Uncharacterized protein n=1 Tax=Gymnopilus junonius TaxID=109634 RepID=A0A9P5NZF7_GYMJU|nr:hypothetical protein CPB84DRAFT_1742913 [Gymnopilus junonius]